MIVSRPAGPTPSRKAWASLLLALSLAGCNDDGDSDPTAPFVDPSGEYSVSLNQAADTCANQIGMINWGGATLDLQENMLIIDIPEAPGDPNCIQTSAPYSMNTIQGSVSRDLTGLCNLRETLTLQIVFTTTGFSGNYTIQRTRISGSCPTLPCAASGTISGVPGLGSPACP